MVFRIIVTVCFILFFNNSFSFSQQLHLSHGDFDISDPSYLEQIPADLQSKRDTSRVDQIYLIQTEKHLDQSEYQTSSARTMVTILRTVPPNGYIATSPAGEDELFHSIPGLKSAIPFHPYFRISPRIFAILESKPRGEGDDTVFLRFAFFPGADLDLAEDILRSEGGFKLIGKTLATGMFDGGLILGKIDHTVLPQILPRLASLPNLEMILPHRRMTLHNNDGIWVHQSFNQGQTTVFDHGINGIGQIAAVSDSGLDEDECYFYDTSNGYSPMNSSPPFTGTAPDMSARKVILYLNMGGDGRGDADSLGPAHGTHTAGSVCGDNYANPATPQSPGHDNGDGMAPGAKLVEQDLGGSLEYLNNGGTFAEVLEAAYVAGARVHSNSWGATCCNSFLGCAFFCIGFDPLNTCNVYDDFARDADMKMWEHQDLLVFVAAGNDGDCGDLTIGTPATAKNIVTVGAHEHGTAANTRGSFSGRGLSYDGRVKPTVMGQGVSVISAAGDNSLNPPSCSTRSMPGTSMACPTVAGLSILIRQYFTDGFYPSGVPYEQQSFVPSGALLKASIIHSALDMTGVSENPPNNFEGYGRVQLDSVLAFPDSMHELLIIDSWAGIKETNPFYTEGTRSYNFHVTSSDQPLKVTLVWTDPPAALAAAPALVNNLDLIIESPNGDIYFRSNIGEIEKSVGEKDSAALADSKNVEEQLTIPVPLTGAYTLKVQGLSINQSPQHFSVVITGDVNWKGPPQQVPALQTLGAIGLIFLVTLILAIQHTRKLTEKKKPLQR